MSSSSLLLYLRPPPSPASSWLLLAPLLTSSAGPQRSKPNAAFPSAPPLSPAPAPLLAPPPTRRRAPHPARRERFLDDLLEPAHVGAMSRFPVTARIMTLSTSSKRLGWSVTAALPRCRLPTSTASSARQSATRAARWDTEKISTTRSLDGNGSGGAVTVELLAATGRERDTAYRDDQARES